MQKIKSLAKDHMPSKLLKVAMNQYFNIKGLIYANSYAGDAVKCPCCGKTFRAFMDFQCSEIHDKIHFSNYTKNIHCPRCFSLPRHRIVCNYLNENREILENNVNILMFGAEFAIERWFKKNNYAYSSADLFDRTADLKEDIQNISFPDESWSVIFCNHVLEHVPDYHLALKELYRILKKGGILELTVPTNKNSDVTHEDLSKLPPQERTRLFGQDDHLRIFGNDIKESIVDAGFSVKVIDGDGLPPIFRTGIGPANYDDNRVYICQK